MRTKRFAWMAGLALMLFMLSAQAATTLFSGDINFPSGDFETGVFTPPAGFSEVDVVMNADPFPTGTTTVTIFMSFDGGATFPSSASMTWIAPHTFPAKFAHIVKFGFSIAGANKTKISSNAPAAFTTNTVINAN